jgi:competence protein ComEC
MALLARLEQVLLAQRGAAYPWAPVCLALGIGLYFQLPQEPAFWAYASAFGLCLGACCLLFIWRSAFAPLIWALFLACAGFLVAGGKGWWVEGAVLQGRYYGPVEGRIVLIDRSASGALRLTLDRVVLENMAPQQTPRRVRISLHGSPQAPLAGAPRAGSTVLITAHLSPPAGPVEPGGFDFQRHAWFQQLGGLGYSRTPLMTLSPPTHGALISRARYGFADFVRSQIAGERGAFAATIMAGDRSGMSQLTVDTLRHTNLAHLLAISGLHMGLLSGFVFASLRAALVLSAGWVHHLPVRRTAALGALAVSFFYLLLSGGSVATERAFVMAMVALGAVFFERRVLSLRAVATAALIVLLWQPEALLGPGFQMSFAATTALVAVFGAMRRYDLWPKRRWARPLVALFVTSSVAGLATAPIAAATFNLFAHYGLIANLLAVPLMGAVVMPAAVIALLLWPLGLAWMGFALMELGIAWILAVAAYFAALEGARGMVAAPPEGVLTLMAAGALFLVIWRGRACLAGILPILAALWLWGQGARPDLLISQDGKLVGLMGAQGRVLSAAKGSGFVARSWLEKDGDARAQALAAQGWSVASTEPASGRRIIHARSKAQVATADCAPGDVLVVAGRLERAVPCLSFDLERLKDTGAVALYFEGAAQVRIRSSKAELGQRRWSR